MVRFSELVKSKLYFVRYSLCQVLLIHFNYIGAANQTYMSCFEYTNYLHDKIADIEQDLQESGELQGSHILFQKLQIPYYGLPGDFYPFYENGNITMANFVL